MAVRIPYLIGLGNNRFVQLQLTSSYSTGLQAALGLLPIVDGRSYNNRILIGRGKLAAMQNGCFGINLIYAKSARVSMTAKVLCSPAKAATIFAEAIGKTYADKLIIEVRTPRQQKYIF